MTVASIIWNSLRSIKSKISYSDYHRMHKQKALNFLKLIKKYNSQDLTPQLKQLADEYAIQVLGGKEFAPWLYVYSAMNGIFKEGWIPDNYFGTVISPSLGLSQATQFKTFSNVILKTEMLPDIGYYIEGILYDKNLSVINLTELLEIIDNKYSDVYVKSDRTDKGKGVRKIATADLSLGLLGQMGNCVIQAPITQHKVFNDIYPSSVANIRVTTVRNLEGKIERRASHVNFGLGADQWTRANNFVQVAVIDREGTLDSYGFDQNLRQWELHPDTGISFFGKQVPLYKEAVENCIQLHTSVPHFPVIGWDVAVDNQNKIHLMEWNAGHIGIKLDEIRTGPCFTGLNWERKYLTK